VTRAVFPVLFAGDKVQRVVGELGMSRDAVTHSGEFIRRRFGDQALRSNGIGGAADPAMGSQATCNAFENALEFARSEARSGDLCVIVFSGHGSSRSGFGWQLHDEVYSGRTLADRLAGFRRGVEIFVVGDCCYSMNVFASRAPLAFQRRWDPATAIAMDSKRQRTFFRRFLLEERRDLLEAQKDDFLLHLRGAGPRVRNGGRLRSRAAVARDGVAARRGADVVYAAAAGIDVEFEPDTTSLFVRALCDSFPLGNPPPDPETYDALHASVDSRHKLRRPKAWTLYAEPEAFMKAAPLAR
jgi:hypothetical protein